MSQRQTALVVTEVGKPLERTTNRPVPQPGPHQVQLKVKVAGLNPHDQYTRDDGLFFGDSLPAVIAADVVGTVTAVGSSVPSGTFSVGDRIVSQGSLLDKATAQNGLQQYAIADAAFSIKIPDLVTDDEAATLPTNIIAGLISLFDETGLGIPGPWAAEASTFDYANASLLTVGGGSNCGKFGVQLAGLAGIGKIIVVGGNEYQLRSFGATHVIDRHGSHDEILAKIREVAGDDLLYAYDTVNPPAGQVLAVHVLSNTRKGKLARLMRRPPLDLEKQLAGTKKAGFEVKNILGSSQFRPDVATPCWKRLPDYLLEGKIVPLDFDVVEDGLNNVEAINAVLDRYRDKKSAPKRVNVHIV